MLAPIAYFAFNRPDHTRQTLTALAQNELASKSKLYIFCDGPRGAQDLNAVSEVRKICRSVTGFASVSLQERVTNQGLAKSIIAGVSTVLETHSSILIFEDDVLSSPGTLRFLNTCLDKYRNEPAIFNVSAWSPTPERMAFPKDYPWDVYFIPRLNCWGWGTWRDRWERIDWDITPSKALLDNPFVRQGFSQGGADMPQMLYAQMEGLLNSWAVRADFSRFLHGQLGVNPIRAYVDNIGLDGTGTHCEKMQSYSVDTRKAIDFVTFPPGVFVCESLQKLYHSFFSNSADNATPIKPAKNPKVENVLEENCKISAQKHQELLKNNDSIVSTNDLSSQGVTSHYDKNYFEWQNDIGQFGGWANLTKFQNHISSTDKVLDFGCGGGWLLKNINCHEKYGIEINDTARAFAMQHNNIIVYKFVKQASNNYFDVIISNNALEHCESPLTELYTLYKKLKPGGRIIFIVPCARWDEPWVPNDINMHIYTWNQMTVGNLFTAAGFIVEKVEQYLHKWPPNYKELVNQGREAFEEAAKIYEKENTELVQIKIIATKPGPDIQPSAMLTVDAPNSPLAKGIYQLSGIIHRRAWNEFPSLGERTINYLRKKFMLNRKKNTDDGHLTGIKCLIASDELDNAYAAANELKKQGPRLGLDELRAEIFLRRGDPDAAIQAFKEELRYFPNNLTACKKLNDLLADQAPPKTENKELNALLAVVAPYTMVGPVRLQYLYENSTRICKSGIPGNFVECGVAAGGSSGLLSAALLRHDASKTKRLFSFDTFTGMPSPTLGDTHQGVNAQDTGWREGTCAAPEESLVQLTDKLGTTHLVTPVKGLFASTLPFIREKIGPIALLHMDGDWYESTLDILNNLYDQLVPGAYVQIDDYGHWAGCRKALHEFFDARGIHVDLHPIDETGVWFTKPDANADKDTHSCNTTLISAALNAKKQSNSRVLVNLGCGARWHPDWINIDINGDNINVFQHNLREDLPLPETSADFIYASHCLEHLAPADAEKFLRACARALKPTGILRIAVPDLEQIVRAYLTEVDALRAKPDSAEHAGRHQWMIVELIDQLCRHQGGGEMLRLWAQPEVPAEDFIISRVGTEYLNARPHLKGAEVPPLRADPQQVGAFRLGGEPHQWMYDEFSLSRLLRQCGFAATQKMTASSSRLEGFVQYCLDTNSDGSVYKPDGFYMEAWLV